MNESPIPIKIVSVLMIFFGAVSVLFGIPMLLIFGLGIIPIGIGILIIKLAFDILKLKKKGYDWTMVLGGIVLALSLLGLLSSNEAIAMAKIPTILFMAVILGVLYLHRALFTK